MLKKLKSNMISILICLFIIFLLFFSKTNIIASKNGLILWSTSIVPCLFPFFVATELLNKTKIPTFIGNLFSKFMKPVFNVPGEGAYAFIMGIICGYPTGAKIVCNLYENKICTKNEAERLLAFTNNSSPLFIIGTIGVSFFYNVQIGFLLFIIHILATFSVGIIFGFFSKITQGSTKNISLKKITYKSSNVESLGEILSNSIFSSISTLFLIGGFVVLFSIIISIFNIIFQNLNITQEYFIGFFSGILELTNGISVVSNILTKKLSYNIILCSFLLGFGGLCVLLQIFSICCKNKLSLKWYITGKLLQGFLSALYTFLILKNIYIINFDL